MIKAIFTDARWIGKHGIGRYAQEVLNRLPMVKPLNMGGRPSNVTDPLKLRIQLNKSKAELFYNPGFNCALFWPGTSIITIHDLIHLDDAAQSSLVKRFYYRFLILPTIRRAPLIFTVSEYSKNRIVKWSKIDPGKVIVAPNGISHEFHCGETYAQKENYLIYVGNSRPHKNTKRMLSAFAKIEDRTLEFVWVGEISKDIQQHISDLKIEDRVKYFRDVEDAVLSQMYAKARATVLVSTIEGFGLPPLESIFCGTRCVISTSSPLIDVLKDFAAVADPYSEESILKAIQQILNKELRFSTEEILQVNKLKLVYNWDRTAEIIKHSLERCM